MGGLGVKVQHFPLTLLVVLTTLTLPCERDDADSPKDVPFGVLMTKNIVQGINPPPKKHPKSRRG